MTLDDLYATVAEYLAPTTTYERRDRIAAEWAKMEIESVGEAIGRMMDMDGER